MYENTHRTSPYDDLYIYYLDGHVLHQHTLYLTNFIGDWQEDQFSFLFFSQPACAQVRGIVAAQPALKLLDEFQISYVDWQGGQIASFRAGKFHIVPPWEKDANETLIDDVLLLDPGVVFGTGGHPTTHDCLEALELACDNQPPQTCLDIGTGTGLLALAAANLGCKDILALDMNYLAVKTALMNVRLNKMEDKILVIKGDAHNFIDFTSDIMISNIHYDVMKKLIKSKGFLFHKKFILSGLLRSQAKQVESKLLEYPIKILEKWSHNGVWFTYYGSIVGK